MVAASGDVKKRVTYPMWRLALIALPQMGVQVLWCFLGPNSAPYMKHLGASASLATLNNVAGPITGFFTGPLVGATSDSCTSKLGRRRPVILFGLISFAAAGLVFAGAEHVMGENAIYMAAPMYWALDVTINILQTPHRALAADFASEEQQFPVQIMFVFIAAIGNFLGYTVMQIYDVPIDHMLELFVGIFLLNAALVALQFFVAKETPLVKDPDAPTKSACAPVHEVIEAVKSSPNLLYHLAFIQCLVWIGITAWNGYGGQWFANSVFEGDSDAPAGSLELEHYADGIAAFSFGGQCKAVAQLLSTLLIIFVMLNTTIRPRFVYAPCIFIGALTSLLAAVAVGHNGNFAEVCMTMSVMPEVGSFAIPFGLIATLNERAAKEGKEVSTALQMALLNCCVTVGQQICTMVLAGIQAGVSLERSLPICFMFAAVTMAVAGGVTLLLNDAPGETVETTSEEENSSAEETAGTTSDECACVSAC